MNVPSLYNYLPCGDPVVCREPTYPTAPNQKWQGRFSTEVNKKCSKAAAGSPRVPGCRRETGRGNGMGSGFLGDVYFDPSNLPGGNGGSNEPIQLPILQLGQQVINLPGGGQTVVPIYIPSGFSTRQTEPEGKPVDAAMCDELREAGASSKAAGVDYAVAWAQIELLADGGYPIDQIKPCFDQGYGGGTTPGDVKVVTHEMCERFRVAGQTSSQSGLDYYQGWDKVREAAVAKGYGASIDWLKRCYDQGYAPIPTEPAQVAAESWAAAVVTAELCEVFRSAGQEAKEKGLDPNQTLVVVWSGMSADIVSEAKGDVVAVGAVQDRLEVCFLGGYQAIDAPEKKSSSGWVLVGAAAVAFGSLLLLGSLGQPTE